MAGARSIRAGQAYVEIYGDDAKLQRTLRNTQRRLRSVGASARMMGGAVFASVAATMAPIGAVAIKAASDANEIRNRYNQVFREQAGQAGSFADELGEQIGRSGTKLRDTLSNYMAFFVGLGFGRDEANKLSQGMTALGLDFASFNNLSDDEASRRFISALAGSSEVVDRFGINLKQAALDLELQRMGLASNVQTADELSKALARYSIISRSMKEQGALGDAARTSAMFANQSRRLNEELFDLKDTIGQGLVPVATDYLTKLNSTIELTEKWAGENPELIRTLFNSAAAVALVSGGVFALGIAVTALANPLLLVAGAAGIATAAIVGTGKGAEAIEDLARAFPEVAQAASETIETVTGLLAAGKIEAAGRAAAAGFRLAWSEALDKMATDFDAWLDRVTNTQDARQKAINSTAGVMTQYGRLFNDGVDAAHEIGLGALGNIARFQVEGGEFDQWVQEQQRERQQNQTRRERQRQTIGIQSQDEILRQFDEESAGPSDRTLDARRELEKYRDELRRTQRDEKEGIEEYERFKNKGDPFFPFETSAEDGQYSRGPTGGTRSRASVSAVGSLSASSALQQLAGAGGDRVASDVRQLKQYAQQIVDNTAQGAAFT